MNPILMGTYGLNASSKKHKKKIKWVAKQRGKAGTSLNNIKVFEFLGD